MRKCFLLMIFPLLILNSCGGDNSNIKTICPVGAPSLCYYTEGNNPNFVTESSTPKVVAQFQQEEYDAIVIDATSGLKAIHDYGKPYALAKLLTANNLYLVSTSKNVKPEKNDKIYAFPGNDDGVPHLALLKYISESGVDVKIDWVDGVSQVAASIKNDSTKYQYYLLANPVYTTLQAVTNINFTFTTKLTTDNMSVIPQAALFINKDSYERKKEKFKTYFDNLNSRILTAIESPDEVRQKLDEYGDSVKIQTRFGFPSRVVTNVQKDNGFGLCDETQKFTADDMNKFLSTVGREERYDSSYFVNI